MQVPQEAASDAPFESVVVVGKNHAIQSQEWGEFGDAEFSGIGLVSRYDVDLFVRMAKENGVLLGQNR